MPTTVKPARPSSTRAIPVRRLEVDLGEADVPRWTVDDDPIFSHFTATLSAVFPKGEEFFVASVRRHRDKVGDDAVLKAQVKAFAGQEAMHGREHRDLNRNLAALGYRTEIADRDIGRILAVLSKLAPSTMPLAVTAAAEHFTGIIAEAALEDETTREVLFGHPAIDALISWHALEELEHKNVAFDVLERAGGGYVVRIAGYGVTVGALAGYVLVEWIRASVADRRHIGRRQLRNFARNLGRQQLLSWRSLGKAVRYLKPGFHPDDMDTDALVLEWKERLTDRTTVTAGMIAA